MLDALARYAVTAAVDFDQGMDGDGRLEVFIALKPWSYRPRQKIDRRDGVRSGNKFLINLRFELREGVACGGRFMTYPDMASLRCESGGALIIADTTSGGPGYTPRPEGIDLISEIEGLQVQNPGWRVHVLSAGQATFLLPALVPWACAGAMQSEAAITVTLTIHAQEHSPPARP